MRFKVNEIFYSVQGEGSRAGRPCLFLRLTGCPLRCVYCDTAYAFHDGAWMEMEVILAEVRSRLGPPRPGPEAPFVEVTGGEPLAIPGTPDLLRALLELGYEVALETAGSHDLAPVPAAVVKLVDRKTPASGEVHRWLESNFDHLVPGQDELKLVIAAESDYPWARDWCAEHKAWDRFTVLFGPAWGAVDPTWLAERVLEDRLPVRVQVQLHKLLWGAERRGV